MPRKRCSESLGREIVDDEYEHCRTELREVCTEPQIDFYIFIEGKCSMVEEKVCDRRGKG